MGLLAEESPERARTAKVEEKRRHVEVRPVHWLSRRECARIILRHEDCPINPLWVKRHFTDCGCGANGDPSELREPEDNFPWFIQRLRGIEESANHGDETDTWGWGGLSADGQQALSAANAVRTGDQMTLCGPGCSRRLSEEVVDAFVDCVDGDDGAETVREVLADG
ncbi:hypothetical protein BRC89_07885 [Halobacteriales archaeon QS_4_70_19]|nr:MAG: hypothetical protein BRC89_07885 [Halobacteriales archaeon QS_4_70_19]